MRSPLLALTPAPPPLRIALCLPSALWNQLLADALNQVPGFLAVPGLEAPPEVLVAGAPVDRAGWDRLAQWCRRPAVAPPGAWPASRVLVLGENRPALAARALRLGAHGYLDSECALPLLVKAIRGVYAGELWAERKVALALVRSAPEQQARQLTPREHHVLEALAGGKRNKEIAAQLDISETTVKSHLNRAYHKLQLTDRLQAALYVERHGLE